VEACLAAASASAGVLMMFLLNDCRPLGEDPTKVPLQVMCHLRINATPFLDRADRGVLYISGEVPR
jgi:hypothetical protein